MSDGLSAKHRDSINKVLAKHSKVDRVVLFGSRAMGTFNATSDVDLALYGDLTMTEQARISLEIDELTIPYKVDLVRMNTVTNTALLEHIKEFGKEFMEGSSQESHSRD